MRTGERGSVAWTRSRSRIERRAPGRGDVARARPRVSEESPASPRLLTMWSGLPPSVGVSGATGRMCAGRTFSRVSGVEAFSAPRPRHPVFRSCLRRAGLYPSAASRGGKAVVPHLAVLRESRALIRPVVRVRDGPPGFSGGKRWKSQKSSSSVTERTVRNASDFTRRWRASLALTWQTSASGRSAFPEARTATAARTPGLRERRFLRSALLVDAFFRAAALPLVPRPPMLDAAAGRPWRPSPARGSKSSGDLP